MSWGSPQTFGRRILKPPVKEECICERPHSLIICHACGYTSNGRVAQICSKHSNTKYLMDYSYCPKCTCEHMLEEYDFEAKRAHVKSKAAGAEKCDVKTMWASAEVSKRPRVVEESMILTETQASSIKMETSDIPSPPAFRRPGVQKQPVQKQLNDAGRELQSVPRESYQLAQRPDPYRGVGGPMLKNCLRVPFQLAQTLAPPFLGTSQNRVQFPAPNPAYRSAPAKGTD